MDQSKRTYRDIKTFILVAVVLQNHPTRTIPITLEYAISRVLKGCRKADDDFNDEISRVNIENASTDEKGRNLASGAHPGQLVYTKEALLKRNAEERELLDTEVEVGIYMAKPIKDPKSERIIPFPLTAAERDAFEGFVIPEMPEPE